ncbi:MAG: bifunctional adenosylcobinamide kinase/adenosylcobinamide-phosphate guanylyltransferase [Deltaproteobacteria bacterium]|nr:bifunctional adenosylcobinamide kinase/adenosylcobinamide-phosphate guanylyltransferase [Candidatus Anaeroferrophillacea bacterium]
MSMPVLVTGGSRSGKSTFAQRLAESLPGRRAYIATAEVSDREMAERIARHQDQRGSAWLMTIEEPRELPAALRRVAANYDIIMVDCVTIWLANLMLADDTRPDAALLARVNDLTAALRETTARTVLVTNEVGSGIVPENRLARRFRDLAGLANQRLAAAAGSVYLVACGLPLKLK